MYLPEAYLWSLAPSPLHTIKTYTHMNPCHALFKTFFSQKKKKVVMAKNRTFFRSEEQAAFLGIQTNSVGQKMSNRHQHSLQHPKAALMSSDAGKRSVSLFHPLRRIKPKVMSLFPHLAPWESVAALQRDFLKTFFLKRICLLNKIWCHLDHKPYPAITMHNNQHWYC